MDFQMNVKTDQVHLDAYLRLRLRLRWRVLFPEAINDPIKARLIAIEVRHPHCAKNLKPLPIFKPGLRHVTPFLDGKMLAAGEKPDD